MSCVKDSHSELYAHPALGFVLPCIQKLVSLPPALSAFWHERDVDRNASRRTGFDEIRNFAPLVELIQFVAPRQVIQLQDSVGRIVVECNTLQHNAATFAALPFPTIM